MSHLPQSHVMTSGIRVENQRCGARHQANPGPSPSLHTHERGQGEVTAEGRGGEWRDFLGEAFRDKRLPEPHRCVCTARGTLSFRKWNRSREAKMVRAEKKVKASGCAISLHG